VQITDGLGDGQIIETEMAEQVGLKIFRTITLVNKWCDEDIVQISAAVEAWYERGCRDMDVKEVKLEPDPSDVELVMSQVECTDATAVSVLRRNNHDIVEAIMMLHNVGH